MDRNGLPVVIQRCDEYKKSIITGLVDDLVNSLDQKHNYTGSVVLLKPNLISGLCDPLACTDKTFIAGVAAWFLDQGAKVCIGDSPAFGSGRYVCEKQGITKTLAGMDVRQADFTDSVEKDLAGGLTVPVAREALECDFFVNLPKVKAHNQMYVTLAVKNIFGIIKGMKKAVLHMTHGSSHDKFSEIILDLLHLLPPSIHLADGIRSMHISGPLDGDPLQLNCVAGSTCPVALDTSLLALLALEKSKSPLWRAGHHRNLQGSDINNIYFPRLFPADFSYAHFVAPESLNAVRFNPVNFMGSIIKRVLLALRV